jgi:universal stress protein A
LSDYQNILVAADFTEAGESAAKRAGNFAKRIGARLTILHVLEHFPEDMPDSFIPPENVDAQKYLIDRAQDSLEKLRDRIEHPGATLEVVVSTRSASREIVHYAQRSGVDLIVVGSHGQHGIIGILGSTANSVLHAATVDVRVVRPTE